MTTPRVVRKSVAKRKPTLDEVLTYLVRINDLGRRFTQGSLDPASVLVTLQCVQEGWGIVEGEPVPGPIPEPTPLTTIRDNIPLAAHQPQAMSKLFRNRDQVVFYHRDGCYDSWFTKNSPECPAATARLVGTPKVMTFRQMAQSATGLATESFPDLSRAIVAKGLDITPTHWDDAIGATQNGEDVLLVNCYTSFAFVKTGKKLKDDKGAEYDEVVMLYAYRRGDGRWNASVGRLDDGHDWNAGYRLLLRNSP